MSIKIDGIPGLDGEYPLDLSTLKNKDFRRVKQMTGVRAMEMEEALEHGDNDVLVAFAAIALERSGTRFLEEQLWEGPIGSCTFVEDVQPEVREPEDPTPSEQPPLNEPDEGTSGGTGEQPGGDTPQT